MNQAQLLDEMSRAARYLAGSDEDRASEINNVGYSSYDGDFGHSLAEKEPGSWTPKMRAAARKLLYKYRKQLAGAGINATAWPEVDTGLAAVVLTDQFSARAGSVSTTERPAEPTVNVWLDPDSTHLKFTARRDASAISKGVIRIRFNYDPALVHSIKEMVPGRAWNPGLREWNATPTPDAIRAAVEFANAHSLSVDPILVSMALEFKDLPQRRIVRAPEGHFEIHFSGLGPGTAVRALPGREWNGAFWTVPGEPMALEALVAFGKRYDFDMEPGLEDEAREAIASLEDSVAASKAESGSIKIPNFGQGGDAPYPFQRGGIEYVLERSASGGVLIADEPGLGKTIQALGAIAAMNAFPAVIVCPATLKENWRREAQRWLPGRSVVVLSGGKVMDLSLLNAHLYIINYDVLDRRKRHTKTTPAGRKGALVDPGDRYAWICSLETEAPRAIVYDESHYCFPYGVPVITDRGWVLIGDIVDRGIGQRVLSFGAGGWEWREIRNRWRNQPSRRLVRIHHSEGDILCTEDHKVWTYEEGYISAVKISRGTHLRVVPGDFRSLTQQPEAVLREFMRRKVAYDAAFPYRAIPTHRKEYGRGQSRPQTTGRSTTNAETERRSEIPSAGRHRESQPARPDVDREAWRSWLYDRAAKALGRITRSIRSLGVRHQDGGSARPIQVSPPLVRGRHWGTRTKTSDRGRRPQSQNETVEISRSAEGVRSIRSRVVRVEILERGDTDRLVGMHGEGQTLYDLEVEGNHNYVANGVLVSNCKNGQARRTKACRELAKSKSTELVLLLTGTPVMNRPVELVSQLQIMGRLEEFGGWKKFTRRYCQAYQGRWGYNTDGAANLKELNSKLRQLCMVRRLKSDVLTELPPKVRSRIILPLSNRAEYNAAEADVIRWIGEQAILNVEKRTAFQASAITEWDQDRCRDANESMQGGLAIVLNHTAERRDLELKGIGRKAYVKARARQLLSSYRGEKEARAAQAEQLVRIEALKQVAVAGKMKAALAWIGDFLETGEQLIVFATHRKVVQEISTAFPDTRKIDGSTPMEARAKAVDDFQSGEAQLIVGNLQAMGFGLTLTAASNVAFLELGWNPAAHDQAEDRAHRIGQDSDSVTAHYLLSEGTIDEEIERLIADKRKVVEAATDGTAAEAAKTSVLSSLVATLRKKGGD